MGKLSYRDHKRLFIQGQMIAVKYQTKTLARFVTAVKLLFTVQRYNYFNAYSLITKIIPLLNNKLERFL